MQTETELEHTHSGLACGEDIQQKGIPEAAGSKKTSRTAPEQKWWNPLNSHLTDLCRTHMLPHTLYTQASSHTSRTAGAAA